VELLIHLLIWQVAQLIGQGRREEAATRCKSNRAALYYPLSPILPNNARGDMARSLSFHRGDCKCMVQPGFLYVWFSSSLNQGMNSDVKLRIPLALVERSETLVEGARTACNGSYI